MKTTTMNKSVREAQLKEKGEEIENLREDLQRMNRLVFKVVKRNSELESQVKYDTHLKIETAHQLKNLLQENEEVSGISFEMKKELSLLLKSKSSSEF